MSEAAFVATALSESELHAIDRYWRAANYLSVGQIYLRDNPLLQQPLTIEHVSHGFLDIGVQRPVSISYTSI